MKKLMILMMALVIGSMAFAEGGKGDCEGKGKRPDFSSLNLSDEQKTKLKSVMKNHREQHHALRDKAGDDRESMRTQMKALRDAHKAEVQKILDDEQFAKFEEIMKKKHKHRKEKRQERMKESGDEKDSRS